MRESPAFPPVDGKLLDEIVARIRSVGDPRRVVLFGSHAHGRGRPDSDLDLLTSRTPIFPAIAGPRGIFGLLWAYSRQRM